MKKIIYRHSPTMDGFCWRQTSCIFFHTLTYGITSLSFHRGYFFSPSPISYLNLFILPQSLFSFDKVFKIYSRSQTFEFLWIWSTQWNTFPFSLYLTCIPATTVEDVEDIGKSFKGELALAAPSKDNVHIFLDNSDMTEPGHVNTDAGAVEREPPQLKFFRRKSFLKDCLLGIVMSQDNQAGGILFALKFRRVSWLTSSTSLRVLRVSSAVNISPAI